MRRSLLISNKSGTRTHVSRTAMLRRIAGKSSPIHILLIHMRARGNIASEDLADGETIFGRGRGEIIREIVSIWGIVGFS